jgi:hypothetical protein
MANHIWHVRVVTLLTSILVASAVSVSLPQAVAQRQESEMHRTLVIPVNLQGRAPVVVDRQQVAQALYGAENSVASRYRTISYGKVEFSGSEGDVVDAVTLSEPADFCNSGLKRLASEAEDNLRRRGIPKEFYHHLVLVIPKDTPCWWTGVGDIGGNRIWVKATTAKALQHELGHNLGMNHAVNWRGFDAEGSDFMGSGETSLNAPHVVGMGWLQSFPGKVVELSKAADVTLESLEADPRRSALPKVAIVRPGAVANTYYLSYRASGSANPLTGEFTKGLNIHIADQARQPGGLTYLVKILSDGATYADGPIIVQQSSHTDGASVTFRISFTGGGNALPAGPPPAPPETVQSWASGKCLDLPGGQTSDGTLAIQYDCRGGPNQQWNIEDAGNAEYRIVSRMSGKCIGTDAASAAAGGHIVQSRCDGSPGQLWALKTAGNGFVIRNVPNGLCLDVPGASIANGVKPIAWICNGGSNQTWRYMPPTAR